MNQAIVQRRLAAILSVDMVGYSRLMAADEEGTLGRLNALRDGLIDPKILEYGGRVVKRLGDGALVEFPSAVNAVRCAIEVQSEIGLHQHSVPDAQRLTFRVGINLGDIIIEGDDIYGDGVNVAARLQTMAKPGGICMSAKVYDEVRSKVEASFTDLGAQRFKNIAQPVRAYCIVPKSSTARLAVTDGDRHRRRQWMAVAAILSLTCAAAIAAWQQPWKTQAETASAERMSLPLPDKPSIAVLAFENLSGDQEQEYFADGIAEDIITDLSRLSGLFVIARNSSFSYRDKSKRIHQIAQELGIRYVLEGSVRKADGTVRVNAQLVDAMTGGYLWAERYDRSLSGLFEIQDDITRRIVDALAAKLVTDRDTQLVQGTRDVDAYDSYLKGWSRLRRTTPSDTAEAARLFREAITRDRDFSRAHAALAAAYLQARRFQWHRSLGLASQYDTETLAVRHIELAMRNPSAPAFRVRAELHYREGRFRSALDDLAEAQKREPNDPVAFAQLGLVRIKMGQADEAMEPLRLAIRLDPNQPLYLAMLGVAEFARGHFAETVRHIESAFARNPEDHAHLDHLVAAYAYLDRIGQAAARAKTMNALRVRAGIEPYTLFIAAKSPLYGNDCDLFRLREGLRRAGIPTGPEPEPPIASASCAASSSR